MDDPAPPVKASTSTALAARGHGEMRWRWIAAVIGVLSVSISLQFDLRLGVSASYTELLSIPSRITAADTTSFQASLGVAGQYLQWEREMRGVRQGSLGPAAAIPRNYGHPRPPVAADQIQLTPKPMPSNLTATFHSSVGNDTMSSKIMSRSTDRHPVPPVKASTSTALAARGHGEMRWRWIAAVIGVLSVSISLQFDLRLGVSASYTV